MASKFVERCRGLARVARARAAERGPAHAPAPAARRAPVLRRGRDARPRARIFLTTLNLRGVLLVLPASKFGKIRLKIGKHFR